MTEKEHYGELTYWCEKGKYQKESDILQKLVPSEGEAQDTRIELFRRVSNTYYDIYNNGGMNIDLKDDGIRYGIHSMKSLGIDLSKTEELIENIEDDDDNLFEASCVEIDIAMDKVIECIISLETNENFKPLLKEIEA